MFSARRVTKDREKLWRFASFGADICVRQCAFIIMCTIEMNQWGLVWMEEALMIVCSNVRSQMCAAMCAHNWNESMRFGLDGRGYVLTVTHSVSHSVSQSLSKVGIELPRAAKNQMFTTRSPAWLAMSAISPDMLCQNKRNTWKPKQTHLCGEP